jgi:hypothetical protein
VRQRRCPNCGGLVGLDAEWCGQCLHRLDEPQDATQPAVTEEHPPARPPEPSAVDLGPDPSPPGTVPSPPRVPGEGFGMRGSGVVWTCPTCGTDNALEAEQCAACGTPFGKLFQRAAPGPKIGPERAAGLSLLFPGLGHVVAGRVAEGVARAVVFAYAVATGISVLVARSGLGLGPFLPLMLLGFAAAAFLYGATAMDAGRVVRGRPPVLTTRMLLYGATTLMLITVAVLVIAGVRASRPG